MYTDTTTPRSDYPRPDRDRSQHWISLNGPWSFYANYGASSTPEGMSKAINEQVPSRICVPFAWETRQSGINRTWLEHGVYSRQVVIPREWLGRRTVLCFGAVFYRAEVYVNEIQIGVHTGGHTSFEFDITDALQTGSRRTPGLDSDFSATITVSVDAPVDKRYIPHGKQRSIPRDDYDGVSFTPTSGIWQSVWLESRGAPYLDTILVDGTSLRGFQINAKLTGLKNFSARTSAAPARCLDNFCGQEVRIKIEESNEETIVSTDENGFLTAFLPIEDPHLWSPSDPFLYRLTLTTGAGHTADQVTVTAGLRKIESRDGVLWFNGERLFVRGVLDQGYWPETGLTAPSKQELVQDLHLARKLGYTMVRKHLKLEDPLWLHEADRIGMLVWAEPPCTSRYSPEGAEAFNLQIADMVARDFNHPSIILWGLYNEEWGLDWDIPGSPIRAAAAAAAFDQLKRCDPTRPAIENSGWSHVKSDIIDWHYYEPQIAVWNQHLAELMRVERDDFPVRLGPNFTVDKHLYGNENPALRNLPNLNSEYGEGFTSVERAWHLRWETQEMRRYDSMSGYVYTELTDVEHEMAGLLDAHRNPKEWAGCIPSAINADTVIVLNVVPREAGADVAIPFAGQLIGFHLSHHGVSEIRGGAYAMWVPAHSPVDFDIRKVAGAVGVDVAGCDVFAEPFVLSPEFFLSVSGTEDPARLLIWVEDESGAVCARTYLDAAEVEAANRRGARPGEFVSVPRPGWKED